MGTFLGTHMNNNPALLFWGALIAGIVGFLFSLSLDRLRQRQERNLHITSLRLELEHNLSVSIRNLTDLRVRIFMGPALEKWPRLRTERIKCMFVYGNLTQAFINNPRLYQQVVQIYTRMTRVNDVFDEAGDLGVPMRGELERQLAELQSAIHDTIENLPSPTRFYKQVKKWLLVAAKCLRSVIGLK